MLTINFGLVDFAVPAYNKVKKKTKRLCQKTKKAMEHEGDSDTTCNRRAWNSLQSLESGMGEFEIEGQIKTIQTIAWDRPEYWE